MRIGGLASGMDTDSIIRDLMKANRIPLDKITQKKAYLEWQLEDYRSINRNLQTSIYKINDTVLRAGTFSAKKVTVSNPNVADIKSVNSTADFSGTLAVGQLATQATWQSDELAKDKEGKDLVTELGVTGNIMINDKEIEVDTSTDTIDSLISKINADPDAGVNAFYDSHTGKIVMTAKNSGADHNITVTGLGSGSGTLDPGKNAKFTFNGLVTERSSNTFQINGFEFVLKQVTGTEADHGVPITFNSTADTDKIVDSVVQFVDDYNKMIEELNAKIREPKYRNFPALTTEQKSDMKENEIKLWEEKAKSGTLKSDPILSSMLSQIRTALVDAKIGEKTLSDIGIKPSSNYSDNGKLIIDEVKLRAAIAEDPEKVSQLFNEKKTDPTKPAGTEGGVAVRMRDIMDVSRQAIAERAGSVGSGNSTFTLGRNLEDMNEQITRFEDRLKMTEDRLWRQFTAMEQAINRANAQSAQLMSAFGGM
ncbi:flagellar hook-associated protein 2 [Sporosarcina beigongshangi]|uniref:flagellar hook-associated protein 2 n=1 Tax=Sporosarcina beigongshangi TaxID=2782538 RepID=UPI00193947E4|nr:flagellar hook-associated protein 2 [Sporosarcina beigongshangi]